ncbi:MAG: cytochrome c biogenesis protein CcdA [FCB group bacterium]|nr:cytochrome c biogenesis protein CcdA [FCB group bacterium]
MFEVSVTYIGALFAGFLSFVSPCVLPLIPGYLSFISGLSIDQLSDKSRRKSNVLRVGASSLLFVFGFSTVFILMGASATFIGDWLREHMSVFNKIAGVVLVLFGLHVMGLFKIKTLNYEKRFHTNSRRFGMISAYFIGLAFAFGWTPCIGPILGAILTVAANEGSVTRGIVLLSFYSAGLGIPFIIFAVLFNYFVGFSGFFKRHFHTVEIISGLLLIAVGILIFFNMLQVLSVYLMEWFPFLQNIG